MKTIRSYDFSEIKEAVKEAESFLLFCHQNPDGDAIGSVTAMGLALKALGKKADYVVEDDKYGIRRILPESGCFNILSEESYDVALILDCSTFEYMYGNGLVSRCAKTVVIDHHDTDPGYGDINLVDGDSAACGEIVYLLIRELGVDITREMAHALYISLSTDTGNFVYSNTTERTHRIASELYGLYDDYHVIAESLMFCPRAVLDCMKIGLSTVEISPDGSAAYFALLYRDGYTDEMNVNTDGLLDAVRYTDGVKVTVYVRQTAEDVFKMSMRSTSDDRDVSLFAGRMGGGGHKRAAGFSYKGTYEDLEKLIKEYLGF